MRKITLGLLRDIKCLRRQIFDPESCWAAVAKRSLACPESHDCACKKSLYATSPDFRTRRFPYPTPLSHPLLYLSHSLPCNCYCVFFRIVHSFHCVDLRGSRIRIPQNIVVIVILRDWLFAAGDCRRAEGMLCRRARRTQS
jgi:hypothetical protein